MVDFHCYCTLATLHELHTYREANTDSLSQKAMSDELDALHKNKICDVVDQPLGKVIVDNKCKIKIRLVDLWNVTKQGASLENIGLFMMKPLPPLLT